ncbi:dienelactone hydrolase family protein [Pseudomonas sp. GV071]|jgi:dienelactone hydrolase|uniref:dienelactone hydrolase family protein n=1 Tax=Pseudomonas sp. GV071 TaxID=2135754 RepID=UPI000D37809C|nr:dienelactone hydrolase family protein [Pseudomonas sp. GV071]PTQ69616.1 dienelactone hydrolase [Pseudomonas sp. GV071]
MSEFSVIPVAYDVDGQAYEGQLVFDASVTSARPGLLLAPNWMGVTDGAIDLAKKAAGKDYVVLVADIYGAQVRPNGHEQAAAAMMPLKNDRALLRKRMQASLEVLQSQKHAAVASDKLAVFGFCFGGCCALELARDGAPVKAAVSFHGTLDTPNNADANNIKGKVLVLHGAADPLVPKEQLPAFEAEMDAAGVDWQLVSYGGAVHSFTDPKADNMPMMKYNPVVAERAFNTMAHLLKEVL